VAARIQECPNHASLVSSKDHGIDTALARNDIAGRGNFTFVTNEEPSLSKDTFKFQSVNLWVSKYPTRNETFLRTHQGCKIIAVGEMRRCATVAAPRPPAASDGRIRHKAVSGERGRK
jgi:hypothetical protein